MQNQKTISYINYRKVTFEKILEYIESNLGSDITVDLLASIANTSKFHFHREFKKYTGESLNNYVKKRRLSYAAFQLLDTNSKIENIGFDINFGSIESFTRAFKKQFLQPPAEFRQKNTLDHYKITPRLNLDLFFNNLPEFTERIFNATTFIGFSIKGVQTKNMNETDKCFKTEFWKFMKALKKYDYPVKNACVYDVNESLCYREEQNGDFYREYKNFFGVPLIKGHQHPDYETRKVPQSKCIYYPFKGALSEYNTHLIQTYSNYLKDLPDKLFNGTSISHYNIGLNNELLNEHGNLCYDSLFNYFSKATNETSFYNSPELISHFHELYTDI